MRRPVPPPGRLRFTSVVGRIGTRLRSMFGDGDPTPPTPETDSFDADAFDVGAFDADAFAGVA